MPLSGWRLRFVVDVLRVETIGERASKTNVPEIKLFSIRFGGSVCGNIWTSQFCRLKLNPMFFALSRGRKFHSGILSSGDLHTDSD